MPIEIRELIIQGSLARTEDQGEESAKLLTSEDIAKIKEEVVDSFQSSGGLTSEQRRTLTNEILQEVKKMLEDNWRR